MLDISGKWHASHLSHQGESGGADSLVDGHRGSQGTGIEGKSLEMSSLRTEILLKTLKSRSMVRIFWFWFFYVGLGSFTLAGSIHCVLAVRIYPDT